MEHIIYMTIIIILIIYIIILNIQNKKKYNELEEKFKYKIGKQYDLFIEKINDLYVEIHELEYKNNELVEIIYKNK